MHHNSFTAHITGFGFEKKSNSTKWFSDFVKNYEKLNSTGLKSPN